jgi:crossover junction endodeoxyribonuclease RusA
MSPEQDQQQEHEMAEKMINEYAPKNGMYGPSMVPPGCEPAGPGAISVWVAGVPAPQGSKRAYGAGRPGGKIRLVESSKRVKPWREDVRQAFLNHHTWALGGSVALVVKVVFVMPRPKATPKTRATPPAVKKPDLDKLERAVLDALTSAGVYADDSQVVALYGYKRLAELGEPTGAMIHIERSPVGCEPTCRMLKAGQGGHPGPCMVLESERHMHDRLCGCGETQDPLSVQV